MSAHERMAIDAISRAAPTLLAAAGRVDGEAAARLVAPGFRADLFGGASRRADGPARDRSSTPTPNAIGVSRRPAMAARFRRAAGAGGGWARRRLEGKALSVLRLAKASATFAGGVDYIAWKINRHAGTEIEIKPWQRRWPLLAAISLLPRLLRSGAVR